MEFEKDGSYSESLESHSQISDMSDNELEIVKDIELDEENNALSAGWINDCCESGCGLMCGDTNFLDLYDQTNKHEYRGTDLLFE